MLKRLFLVPCFFCLLFFDFVLKDKKWIQYKTKRKRVSAGFWLFFVFFFDCACALFFVVITREREIERRKGGAVLLKGQGEVWKTHPHEK